MKKLIVYYAGEWAERLLTVERYKEVAYFIEDAPQAENTDFWGIGAAKPIYTPDVLQKEDPEEIVIIISDNVRCKDAKTVLEGMGFRENYH
ncbi:MAG: hypothetical protein K5695_13435, partial [Oscillospiraceae bacterium]|nr:hypothetical protein [Oscillospiraceae bacterium]